MFSLRPHARATVTPPWVHAPTSAATQREGRRRPPSTRHDAPAASLTRRHSMGTTRITSDSLGRLWRRKRRRQLALRAAIMTAAVAALLALTESMTAPSIVAPPAPTTLVEERNL